MIYCAVDKDTTYAVIAYNIHEKDGKHEMWIRKADGKALLIDRRDTEEEVRIYKNAFDYAIEKGERLVKLYSEE